MKLSDFAFDLPKERIAQQPLPKGQAKMLCVAEKFNSSHISQLPSFLKEDDVVVFNDTKVIKAFLVAHHHLVPTRKITINLNKQINLLEWSAFAKPGKKAKEGDIFIVAEDFKFIVKQKQIDGSLIISFLCTPDTVFSKLEQYGNMPLPSYIKRSIKDDTDDYNYQTIFAKHEGAVAAPTAGLHFTTELLEAIKHKGAKVAFITLCVGGGTFLPVKSEDITQHVMHSEYYNLTVENATLINEQRSKGGRVIAVGTTSVRVLESIAEESGIVHAACGETNIFITPGYRFKIVDMLLTNFHLPKSTLFMLVAAFAGLEKMKEAYQFAIEQKYRFYSYGDACLIYRL